MTRFSSVFCRSASALLAVSALPASAQGIADGVDPVTISVPDLAFTPTREDTERFYKFFYFNKPGVSFAQAADDLAECEGYAAVDGIYLDVPKFVPLALPDEGRSSSGRFDAAMTSNLGVGGSLIFSLLSDGLVDKLRLGNLITCMGYKGYKRYGLSRAVWKAVNEGDRRDVILRNAKIASGPAPSAESLWP